MDRSLPKVFVGDSQNMIVFKDPSLTVKERFIKNMGFYLHQSGIIELFNQRAGIEVSKVLNNSNPADSVAEISMPLRGDRTFDRVAAENYFDGSGVGWTKLYPDQGFHPSTCNVNGLDVSAKAQSLADWELYKTMLASKGLTRCGAFGDPNDGNRLHFAFNTDYWKFYKNVALILGGVALDTPPFFALTQGHEYIKHVVDVVKWARQEHLRVSIVMAVYNDGKMYESHMNKYVCMLISQHAVPTEWIVGGYEDGGNNREAVAHLGAETDPSTLNSAAVKLAYGLQCDV